MLKEAFLFVEVSLFDRPNAYQANRTSSGAMRKGYLLHVSMWFTCFTYLTNLPIS